MHSKKLKYQKYISHFSNCPPLLYQEKEKIAFRWVFSACNEDSFKPVLIIQPARQLGDEDSTCGGYALSLFEEEDGAYQRYKKLVENKPHLKKILGTMIAKLKLDINEGVGSEAGNYTHFNFHEYEETNLLKKIITIADIFDDDGNFKY